MKKRCLLFLIGTCSIFFYCLAPRGGWYFIAALEILRKYDREKQTLKQSNRCIPKIVCPINTHIKKINKES